MNLPEICVKRPVFATVMSLIIMVIGIISYTKLEIRGLPNIEQPIVSISANYFGVDAKFMERKVTIPIEEAIRNIKNLDSFSSSSSSGASQITVIFKLNTDLEEAVNDIRGKLSEINGVFPDDMSQPSVSKMDADAFPTLWLAITSDGYNRMKSTEIIEDYIKLPLEQLETVGDSRFPGARYASVIIEPDPVKLNAYKITPQEIEHALKTQNQDYPSGEIKGDARTYQLKLSTSLAKIEQFKDIIIRSEKNSLIKLQDIAQIFLKPENDDTIIRFNAKPSLAIGLVKHSTSNILAMSQQVLTKIPELKKSLPKGIDILVAYDGARPVQASINAVYRTIFEALILVIIVIYLFLGSIRATMIPFVTIPISLIGAFAFINYAGFSINTFTLLAMILAIGLVVDDAIIVLENIYRYIEQGKKPIEAVLEGVKEIKFAVIATTASLAAVFLPIGFVEGFVGKLFIEFAWTLAFAVIVSGFVALSVVPMMCSKILSSKDHQSPNYIIAKFNYYYAKLDRFYQTSLLWTINNTKIFVMICITAVIIMLMAFKLVNKEFVPQEDSAMLTVSFSGPEGSSEILTDKIVAQAEEVLKQDHDIEGFFTIIGWGGGNNAFAFVPLKEWSLRSRSQHQIINELNQKFADIPGMSIFAMHPRSLASGNASKPVEFKILSSTASIEKLDKISQIFVKEMEKLQIFYNIERDYKNTIPTLNIALDRDKTAIYQIDIANIGATIGHLISGKNAGDFKVGSKLYPVKLRFNKENRQNIEDLNKILIKSKLGHMVPISNIATIKTIVTEKSLNRYNNANSVEISAALVDNIDINTVIEKVNNIAKNLLVEDNTKLEFVGEIERMQESNNQMIFTFLFALIFIFLILAAQFESFKDPLIILLAVPFSITGGILALLIIGSSINLYSNIGLVTLIGLVTKNSVMIVEFANQIHARGTKISDAVIEAAKLRLRPILMTSIATSFGAMPLVFASGAESIARNSIGYTIVGGMFVGTIFALYVIPNLYQRFK